MIKKFLTNFVVSLINFYKYLISPLLGNNCRYLPTCSEYTKESVKKFGIISGVWLGLKRITDAIHGERVVMILLNSYIIIIF